MSTAAHTAVPATFLKPGVVTGDDYRALVAAAKAGGYALPAINVIGTNTINGVLEAASKNRSDVIIQLSNGGAQFYAGQGFPDPVQAKVLGAVSAAKHVHLMAEHYERSPQTVAGIIVMSTLIAFLCLPFVVWLAMTPTGAT